MMTQYVFAPQAPISIPVVGSDEQFPVRRVYCVGRNYAAHAREMGFDPDREPPFFFCKPADAVVPVAAGETLGLPYPAQTDNYHYEIELVVAIGKAGRDIPLEQAQELMLRYTGLALSDTQGVGLDSLRYLSEYNAYYRVGGEAEAAYCRILSGWHTADGLTVLQYDGGTVTLRQLDGRWVFVSNVPGRSA